METAESITMSLFLLLDLMGIKTGIVQLYFAAEKETYRVSTKKDLLLVYGRGLMLKDPFFVDTLYVEFMERD